MEITLAKVITFIIILIVLVIIHEFGHFFAAKKNGVKVEEFGFGFPPRIFGKKIGETLYSINLIPLGGFVKLYGEEYHETGKKKDISSERAFVNKKPWQKTLIIVAGVLMNFFLGWILISILLISGVPAPSGVTVNNVQQDSPAAEGGLIKNDTLVSIQQEDKIVTIITAQDLISATKEFAGEEVVLVVQRDESEQTIRLTPRENPPQGQGSLGIEIGQLVEIKTYPWYSAPYYGLLEAITMTKTIAIELLKIPAQLITQQKTDVEFSGPVGIVNIVGDALSHGLKAVIQLTALLSLNLAIINILPIPALDGGRLVFVLFEWVTGKRTNPNLERYLNLIGIILLLTLSAVITVHDIQKLWG